MQKGGHFWRGYIMELMLIIVMLMSMLFKLMFVLRMVMKMRDLDIFGLMVFWCWCFKIMLMLISSKEKNFFRLSVIRVFRCWYIDDAEDYGTDIFGQGVTGVLIPFIISWSALSASLCTDGPYLRRILTTPPSPLSSFRGIVIRTLKLR